MKHQSLAILIVVLLLTGLFAIEAAADNAAQTCFDPTGAPIPCPSGGGDDEPPDTRTEGDRDGDGTIDVLDACPDAGGPNNNRGCPPDINPDDIAPPDDGGGEPPVLLPVPGALPELPGFPEQGRCLLATLGQFFVNVRNVPSLSGEVVGTLGPQDVAEVAFGVLNDEGLWWKVVDPNGFVSGDVVRLGPSCDQIPIIDRRTMPTAMIADEQLNPDVHVLQIMPDTSPQTREHILLSMGPHTPNGNNMQPGDEIMVLLRPAPGALPDPDDEVLVLFLHGQDLGFTPDPAPPQAGAPDSFFDIWIGEAMQSAMMDVLGSQEPVVLIMRPFGPGFNPDPPPPDGEPHQEVGPAVPGDDVAFNPQPEPPADPLSEDPGFNPDPPPPEEQQAAPAVPGSDVAFNPQPEPPGDSCNGCLVISNIGSSGDDGVEVGSFMPTHTAVILLPAVMPDGSFNTDDEIMVLLMPAQGNSGAPTPVVEIAGVLLPMGNGGGENSPFGWSWSVENNPFGWSWSGEDNPFGWSWSTEDNPIGWSWSGEDNPFGWSWSFGSWEAQFEGFMPY